MKPRQWLLPAALALTLAAAAGVSGLESEGASAYGIPGNPPGRAPVARDVGVVPGPGAGPGTTAPQAAPDPAAEQPAAWSTRRGAWPAVPSRALAAWGGAASTARAAAPAASAVATPPAASSPAAPPRFPYTWIGRIETGGDVQVLLNGPQRSFGARAGEVLDGRWRIEQIAAGRLQLTWLPTGETVTVDAR